MLRMRRVLGNGEWGDGDASGTGKARSITGGFG